MAFALAVLAIYLATAAAAWRWGGPSERTGAQILLAMVVVTYVGYFVITKPVFRMVDPVSVAVDVIGLVGFTRLGLVSRKFWPLWAASLQLLSTGAHLVRALRMPVEAPVYYWMKMVPTVGVIVLLVTATMLHRRRLIRARRNSSRS